MRPVGVSAGGLTGSLKNGNIVVGSTASRQGLVRGLSETSLDQAEQLLGLRGRVAPGVSDLRTARLAEIDNARRSSISNLKDNLARRRVLGSSFGEDAMARSELEFAQERDRVQAETFMQELELTNNLINQEFDARRTAFSTRVNELNLQADLATKLSSDATQLLQTSAQFKSQLASSLFCLVGSLLLGPSFRTAGREISESLFA